MLDYLFNICGFLAPLFLLGTKSVPLKYVKRYLKCIQLELAQEETWSCLVHSHDCSGISTPSSLTLSRPQPVVEAWMMEKDM